MRRILISILSLLTLIMLTMNVIFAAGIEDNTIPAPTNVTLNRDGVVTWSADDDFLYKSFQIRLLKRADVNENGSIVYKYNTHGSNKTADGSERSYDVTFGSVGYYRVRVRALNLSGNYSEWTESTEDVPVTEEDITVNLYSNNNSYAYNSSSSAGPGVVNNTVNNNQVAGPSITATVGNQNNNVAGPLYNQSQGPGVINNANTSSSVNAVGPGAVNQNQNTTSYVSNSVLNPTGNSNTGTGITSNSVLNTTGNVSSSNVNAQRSVGSGAAAIPANTITGADGPGRTTTNVSSYGATEIGWHVDSGGRYFYQGNGVYLINTWAEIGGVFYRFDNTGHVIVNSWYTDVATGNRYLLGSEGEMLLGWQKKDGKWYYLNPNRGSSYGVMYYNSILAIDGAIYAFSADGVMIQDAWYNGYYYGHDGARI